jgi:hypothetical protein
MAMTEPKDLEARRAYRRELRSVARLLRWSGIALGYPGAWFTGPSWFSFVLGCALVISGIVRRQAKASAVEPDE